MPEGRPGGRGRWPRSLYARLSLVLLVLVGLVGAAGLAINLWTVRRYQEEAEQRLNHDLAGALLSDTTIFQDGVRQEDLDHIFHMLMVVNPRIEVYLLDRGGRILGYSAPAGRVVRDRVSLQPIRDFLAGDRRLPLRGDDPRSRGGRKIFSVAPIPAPGGDAAPDAEGPGYLYVVLGGEQYDSVLHRLRGSYILRTSGGVAVAALALAAALGLVLFRVLTRRLARLDSRIRGFHREGYLPGPVAPGGDPGVPGPPAGDEIDRLEEAFERMAARIEGQMAELAQLDELRRELVANVSHDLRTPIAALQGYLETLLMKDAALSPEERRQYLEIAERHSQHLGKLVAQLFELARLDVAEARLDLETVSLAELAQDVVQKFGLAAGERGIELVAELPARLPFVRADIRLLERAFDNLIENALAHTPAGGRVVVGLAEGDEGVVVRCEDSGAGIPPEELPRVFDRFFRGRGGRAGGGAGLGLAITKRILELHGARLEVASAVGHGTAFSFRLPFPAH